MDYTGLSASIGFNASNPGNEPLGQTIEVQVRPDGFHDASGIGSGGDTGTLGVRDVAAMLRERFDLAELEALLSHLAELHAAIVRPA